MIEADWTAQICGIAQTAAIHVSASSGLGRHIHTLSHHSYEVFARFYYASDLLFVITIYLAKVSLVLFIMRLTPSYKTLWFSYSFLIVLTIWSLGTVFSLAFQCPLPQAWNFMRLQSAKCGVNIAATYYSIGIVDIVTDLIIVITPAVIVWNVQISHRQRFTVIGVFSCRLAVCICSALLLASIPEFLRSSDRSWEAVTPQTWRQVVQCLSIITACIPCLRPFLTSLESGFMDSSMQGVIGRTYGGSSGQGSGMKNGTGSLELTSLAAGGRRAIINPRRLDQTRDAEKKPSTLLAGNAVWTGSLLSPRSSALSAPQGSETLIKSGTLYSGPKYYSFSRNQSLTEISVESRRNSNRPATSLQGQRAQSTDTIEMLASSSTRRLNHNPQRERHDEGCIRETREVVISIEREGPRLIDGILYTHDSTVSSSPSTEQQSL